MYANLGLYIDGQWLNGDGRARRGRDQPGDRKAARARCRTRAPPISTSALEAAEEGFAVWRATAAYDRAKIMRKAADLMRERARRHRADHWCRSRARPIAEARMRGAHLRRHHRMVCRGRPPRLWPHRAGPRQGMRQIVVQEPVGIVAAFTPWNFPTLTPARKIGGALAAGCSIIIKASEETPGACVELVRCFADAGLPAGVLNLVFGVPAKVSEHLIASDVVRKISFTGSIPVGKHLAGARGQGHEARHHGAWRPFAGRGVRRRRSGKDRRHHRGVQVPQRRAGLHLADALLCAGAGL